MKKAILFGASGFIGSYLLEYLLASANYNEVIIVVRKELSIQHPKLKTIIADYHTLKDYKSLLVANDVFITLGTTKKKTPDTREYYQIDHDYPLLAAALTKANGAHSILMVTAVGANEHSSIFYTKTKGEVERDVKALDFAHTYIFRPSMIMGERAENRPMEKIFMQVSSVVNKILIGGLNKYKGIKAKEVALAMFKASEQPTEKVKILHWQEMQELIK